MAGVTRFDIIDTCEGRGASRMAKAKNYWPAANALYRQIFTDQFNMPLEEEDETIRCTKAEFEAGYDYQLGIDVILHPRGQCCCTLQEKFLTYHEYTLTVEHCQDWQTLEPGDWYKLKAQYYFVGYDQFQRLKLDPWVLVDWARLQRETALSHIPWRMRCNNPTKVGARASFVYVEFKDLPPEAIAACSDYARHVMLLESQGVHYG